MTDTSAVPAPDPRTEPAAAATPTPVSTTTPVSKTAPVSTTPDPVDGSTPTRTAELSATKVTPGAASPVTPAASATARSAGMSATAHSRSTAARSARDQRAFVLDTCVLLADPGALTRFDEHDVVIPLVVIEELDRKKTALDDVGRNARLALRAIEELRVASGGGLHEALRLPSGGTVRIESNHVDVPLPPYLDANKPDHRILCVAIGLEGTLVTKDAALRIKGSQLGVHVEDYRGDTARTDEHVTGILDLEVDPQVLADLHRDGKARIHTEVADLSGAPEGLWPNACLVLKAGRSNSGLGRVLDVEADGTATVHRVPGHRTAFGMSPRDVRQTFAIDLLLDPDVPCVSLMGMAGTVMSGCNMSRQRGTTLEVVA